MSELREKGVGRKPPDAKANTNPTATTRQALRVQTSIMRTMRDVSMEWGSSDRPIALYRNSGGIAPFNRRRDPAADDRARTNWGLFRRGRSLRLGVLGSGRIGLRLDRMNLVQHLVDVAGKDELRRPLLLEGDFRRHRSPREHATHGRPQGAQRI